MTDQQKSKRGGYRTGSGRKPGERTEAIYIRVSPEAKAVLDTVTNRSEYIDNLILNQR